LQNHCVVPKITKMDAFSLFQSKTPLFHDEATPFTSFTAGLKARTVRLQSPKSKPPSSKKSDATNTHTHTDSQNKERPTHSKFKFQLQIAQKTHEVVSGAKKIAPRQWHICKDLQAQNKHVCAHMKRRARANLSIDSR
jgi:hypothetical protein